MDPAPRRAYRRESSDARKADLIAAMQSLVAEGGAESATVRAVAERAGVTPGLIRHYFGSKEELTRAAYLALMDNMTTKGSDALEGVGASPEERLVAFVATALRPPVVDAGAVGLWAWYMHKMRNDTELRAAHETGYLAFRDILQSLIEAIPRQSGPDRARADAIACNALIDGLWLEGSTLPHAFASGEIVELGIQAVGAIIGVDLLPHAGTVIGKKVKAK
jgi:TetR/AcrR family transcriptional regulator, transcriptional repressor of bet genes